MNNMEQGKYISKLSDLMSDIGKNFQHLAFESCDQEITMQQAMVLKFIKSLGNPKMTDLSHAVGVTLGNMTMMVDRLIKNGFVKRMTDPQDRRIVRVELTERSKIMINKIKKRHSDHMEKILSKIPEHDKQQLLANLQKIADIIKSD